MIKMTENPTGIYRNPAVTADLIVIRQKRNRLEFLAIERGNEPFKGMFALPGGHINYGQETLEEAGIRELYEETGLAARKRDLRLIGTYSWPARDPRGHYVTAAYAVLKYKGEPKAGDDAKNLIWLPLNNPPKLAFDHDEIVRDYKKWRRKWQKIK
jgi:8-oxo-dGTP diphosphatase